MRVITSVLCVAMTSLLLLSPTAVLPVRAQTAAPVTAQCGDPGRAWFEPDGTVVVDRRKLAQGTNAIFRLDDTNGYSLFPATNAPVVVLPVPNGGAPLNVSIAQITERGTVKTCAPTVDVPAKQSPRDAPVLDGPSVDHLVAASHIADPITCDRPFRDSVVVNAPVPNMPALASAQGVSGIVSVLVVLDPSGQVTSSTILQTPSMLLNEPALSSARQAQYLPALFRCRPIASRYRFVVQFARR